MAALIQENRSLLRRLDKSRAPDIGAASTEPLLPTGALKSIKAIKKRNRNITGQVFLKSKDVDKRLQRNDRDSESSDGQPDSELGQFNLDGSVGDLRRLGEVLTPLVYKLGVGPEVERRPRMSKGRANVEATARRERSAYKSSRTHIYLLVSGIILVQKYTYHSTIQ